jgi:hypothetical protein
MPVETKRVIAAKTVGFKKPLFAVGFNTLQLAAVKLWQRLEFMVVNPTRTKNFLYKKKYAAACGGVFFIVANKFLFQFFYIPIYFIPLFLFFVKSFSIFKL